MCESEAIEATIKEVQANATRRNSTRCVPPLPPHTPTSSTFVCLLTFNAERIRIWKGSDVASVTEPRIVPQKRLAFSAENDLKHDGNGTKSYRRTESKPH